MVRVFIYVIYCQLYVFGITHVAVINFLLSYLRITTFFSRILLNFET